MLVADETRLNTSKLEASAGAKTVIESSVESEMLGQAVQAKG